MATCAKCKRSIVFVETSSGRRMPCDPDEVAIVPASTATVSGITEAGEIKRGRRATDGELEASPDVVRVRVSHFATCPSASHFRRGSR